LEQSLAERLDLAVVPHASPLFRPAALRRRDRAARSPTRTRGLARALSLLSASERP